MPSGFECHLYRSWQHSLWHLHYLLKLVDMVGQTWRPDKKILLALNLNKAPSITSILTASTNTLPSLLWTGIDFVFPEKHFL